MKYLFVAVVALVMAGCAGPNQRTGCGCSSKCDCTKDCECMRGGCCQHGCGVPCPCCGRHKAD